MIKKAKKKPNLLKLRVFFLNGPQKGNYFTVKKGLILTRNKKEEGDIFVEDPKASNPHAEIIKKKGGFYLQDMDSKNGTYVNEEISDLFALKPGLKFRIGKTFFKVKAPPKPPKPKKPWPEAVTEELSNLSLKDRPRKLSPIQPSLILNFKSGVQKGDKWHICYGPRTAGSESLDLPILEPQAPDICFSLEPDKSSVLFKTSYPEKVLLNKDHISKKNLKAGDLISFASMLIEVRYKKK